MSAFKLSVLSAALLASQAVAKHTDQVTIDPETRMFIDKEGRSILFHGVNVVYKVDPFIPSDGAFDGNDSLNDEDIANLVKWG